MNDAVFHVQFGKVRVFALGKSNKPYEKIALACAEAVADDLQVVCLPTCSND
jgi:hypothetical protein